MSRHITPLDISNIPALRQVIEEIRHTKQPRLLKQDRQTVAMLIPLGTALDAPPEQIWTNYHPEKVQHALQQSTGILAGVDKAALQQDLARERGQEGREHAL